jgi:hypothetical protein
MSISEKDDILFYQNKGCIWSLYDDTFFEFYSKNRNITENECKLACINNTRCTGFELSQYGTSLSPFCLLWFDGTCFEPNYEYNNNYNIDTYSIISKSFLNNDIISYILILSIIFIVFLLGCVGICYTGCTNKCKPPPKIVKVYYINESNESNENDVIIDAYVHTN